MLEDMAHLFFTVDFYFRQNIEKLTWADCNYELAVLPRDPKTRHIEAQKDLLSG